MIRSFHTNVGSSIFMKHQPHRNDCFLDNSDCLCDYSGTWHTDSWTISESHCGRVEMSLIYMLALWHSDTFSDI